MSLVTGNDALRFATSIDNSGLSQGSIEAQGILRQLTGSISSMDVFAGLSIGAAIAFSKIAESAYKMSKEFETSMKEVQTISKSVQDDYDGMSQKLVDMTSEIPYSATELSKAFYDIASAGYDGAEGLELLRMAGKGAVAGVTDIKTSADGLTTIMNAWKLSAGEAESVTDQLFQTVKLGKTTFPQLAGNISDVASIAASANIPLNEILGAIASMTKQGIPTSQAFTQIRQAILATNKVLGDGWSETMSFQEGMQAIADKSGGSQTKLTSMVGSVEALNAVLALSGDNAKMAADDLQAVSNSAGSAGTAFETMMDSAENQSKLLANNIEAALKPLGDYILETFTDLTSFVNEAFKSGDIEKFAKVLGIAVTSLIAIKATSSLASISMSDFKNALLKAGNALQTLNTSIKANPLGLLVAALAAAAAAYVVYEDKIKGVSELQKTLNSVSAETQKRFRDESTGLELVKKGLDKTNISQTERKSLIDKLNTQYGKYLPNLLDENASLDDIRKAYDKINASLRTKIQLQVQEEKASETYRKLIDLQEEFNGMSESSMERFSNKIQQIQGSMIGATLIKTKRTKETVAKELNEIRGIYDNLINSIASTQPVLEYDRTDDVTKPTGNNGKIKEQTTYLQKLKEALDDAKAGLESLSGTDTDLNAVASQKLIIDNLETQIQQQEDILGLREKSTQNIDTEKQALLGSIAFEENKLSLLREQFKYADSQAERNRLNSEIDLQEKYIESLSGIKSEKIEISEMNLDTLIATRNAIIEEMEGVDKLSDKYKELAKLKLETEKNIGLIVGDGLINIANVIGSLANKIGGLNGALGETIGNLATIAGDVGNLIQGLATGNLVKIGASIANIVVDLFTIKKRRREKEQQEHEQRVADLIELQNDKLGDQLKLLNKAKGTDVYEAYKKSFEQIQQSIDEIIRLSGHKKMGWLTGEKADIIDADYLEQYNKLLEEQANLKEQMYNDLTGTTSDSITDSILQGFENGQLAAKDFAGTFEDLMKQAILNTFKLQFLDKQFDEFYKAFGEAAESGGALTPSEISELQNQFNANIDIARQGFDSFNQLFEQTFGNSITSGARQGMAGEIAASLTEETGTVLAGTLNSIRLYVASQNTILDEMRGYLSSIKDNTSYNRELVRLERIESLLSEQSQTLRSIGV
jgi:TP901 family phage tail tape measure protein